MSSSLYAFRKAMSAHRGHFELRIAETTISPGDWF